MPTLQIVRPVLGFNSFTEGQLNSLGGAIDTGLYVNTADYPNPPVDHATFKAQFGAFSACVIAAADGGKKATAEKKKHRIAFCKMLRQLGHYVEVSCREDMAIFLSSGFQPVATVRTQQPVAVPCIVSVTHGNTGQLIVRVKSRRNVRTLAVRYGVPVANEEPASWTKTSFTNGQSMVLNGLTPAITYWVQVQALGTLGCSDWTDSVVRICV